jgi:hypothetical protein
MKKTILLAISLSLSASLQAQQTIKQFIDLRSNGVNSTEILMRKLDSVNYNSLYSNNLGFGLYNSSSNKTNFFINYADNIGIGTLEPQQKLDVRGNAIINGALISTIADQNIGGTIQIDNPAKTTNGTANSWKIYNMGGGYGNSLQFWAYDVPGCNGGMCANKFTLMDNGNVGIGTANPTALLQIGDFKSAYQSKQVIIPGVYNFERLQLGQLGNGNAALEMVNHNSVDNSYGIKLMTNIDNGGPGLQFQYAKSKSSYETLEYQTAMFLDLNGQIGIGTLSPQEKLTVAGTIGAREIKVSASSGADFVFEPGYQLPDLAELEKFVKTNKHLPEIPTAKQMVDHGVNLGELNIKLLEKVEELTLHLIEKDKELKNDASLIKNQQVQIDGLKKDYLELKEYLLKKK